MDTCENKTVEKTNSQKQSYSVLIPQETEKCKGCHYAGVGFICWDQDGSCMKTDVEKICSKSRR